jgi:hypothetical protein
MSTVPTIYRVVAPSSKHKGELGVMIGERNKIVYLLNLERKTIHLDTRNKLTKDNRPRESFWVARSSIEEVTHPTKEQTRKAISAYKRKYDYVYDC